MDICTIVDRMKNKYETSNPYLIAKDMGILILYEELGSINGYYNMVFRQKQIHINHSLNQHSKKLTLAHELGHAVLHPKANTPFLTNSTFLSVNKMEIEANKFAMELLISDIEILENQHYTISQLSRMLGYREELIELRLK